MSQKKKINMTTKTNLQFGIPKLNSSAFLITAFTPTVQSQMAVMVTAMCKCVCVFRLAVGACLVRPFFRLIIPIFGYTTQHILIRALDKLFVMVAPVRLTNFS